MQPTALAVGYRNLKPNPAPEGRKSSTHPKGIDRRYGALPFQACHPALACSPIVPSDSDFSTLGSPVPQLYNRLKKQQSLRS
jgi:hypothetical protein